MSTPVVHLAIAQDILAAARRPLLERERGYFYFGNLVPDVRTIAELRREDTHFYHLVAERQRGSGFDVLLERYPSLIDGAALGAGGVTYVAGYGTHLLVDEVWLEKIFTPYFWRGADHPLARRPDRALLHNTYRVYHEELEAARLRDRAAVRRDLMAVRDLPGLPFVDPEQVRQWHRQMLEMLGSEDLVSSARYFAEKAAQDEGVEHDFAATDSEARWLVLSMVPAHLIDEFRAEAIRRSVALVQGYFKQAGAPL